MTHLFPSLAGWLGAGVATSLLLWLMLRGYATAHRASRAAAETTRELRDSEERFRTLTQASPTGVFLSDADGTMTYANPRLLDVLGLDEIPGPYLFEMIHNEDVERCIAAWSTAARTGTTMRGTYRIIRHDGGLRWVDVASSPTKDDRGTTTAWIGTVSDVTTMVESQRRTARLTRILEHTTDLVTLTDPDGEVVWANEAARSFFRDAGLVPHRLTDLVAPSFLATFETTVLPALREQGVWSGELLLHGGPDLEIPVSQLIQAHYGPDGALQHYSLCARDLSERDRLQSRLAHESLHDRLTDLPNRALFVDRLSQSLARTARRESLLAVLMVDLDRFQVLNETLGHEAGDRLLVEVSHRLAEVLRSGDTAARFGGDEFALLCEDVVDVAQATAIAKRVLATIAVPFVLDGAPLHVTASVGIALSDGSSHRAEDLVRDADAALHRAKDLGKARFQLFDERLREYAVARFETESALHAALDHGELRVHYQPEVELGTGRIIGAEALVRWLHPVNGLIGPDDFVPLAEETGLIEEIGAWVLREACWEAARWRRVREDGKPFVVWVNISPRQLTPDLVTAVRRTLDETTVDPASLGLEVTETGLLGDADEAIAVLRALRDLGVGITIDDFGTGYSSLAYLRRLPIDALKIDRSFVSQLGTSVEDSAIVHAIIKMAGALGLTAVAEGIETREQLEELVRLGCDIGQGFYFSKAEPRQAIDALLTASPRPMWPGAGASIPGPRADAVTELDPVRRRGRPHRLDAG